jgi:GNAT superfamily N-acetyltransferase
MSAVRIELVAPDVIVPLRHAVLRQGLPFDSARFDGDLAPGAVHVAGFAEQKLVCCASFIPNALANEAAAQLRGMATDPAFRSQGIGGAVLAAGERQIVANGFPLLWCNARVGAIRFYERHGWTVISDEFVIEHAGPHRVMRKRL